MAGVSAGKGDQVGKKGKGGGGGAEGYVEMLYSVDH